MWFTYILKCFDGSFYIGATNDLEKRIATHNAGKGARYTKGRLPVKLVKFFEVNSKSEALKLEIKLKKLSKKQKIKLINDL
jgi:putative endonuclease